MLKLKDMRHRIDLQSRVDAVDEIGQPSTSWESVAFLWADIRYLNGLSAIKAVADTSTSKVSIRARHGTFNAGQRIVCGNEVFEIDAVLPDGKKSYVDLVATVINADV